MHRIGLSMYKYSKGEVPIALMVLYLTQQQAHTRCVGKLRPAVGKHEFMYKNYSVISIGIWNLINTKLNVNVSF